MTEHFTMADVIRSHTAKRLKIDNTLPEKYRLNAYFAAANLENFHWMVKVITSWYRSPTLNQTVGGQAASLHSRALAVDFLVDTDAIHAAQLLRAMQYPNLYKVIAYTEEEHPRLHVAFAINGPAPRFYHRSKGQYLLLP